jgi:Flp pilus assembly pilin Flp
MRTADKVDEAMVTDMITMGFRGEGGQGLVEYALILLLVAVAAVATLTIFGNTLMNTYLTIVASF